MDLTILNKKQNIYQITCEDFGILEKIRENFSIIERNFAKIRTGRGPDYIRRSCIKANGEFEMGMLPAIIDFCKNNFHEYRLNFKFADTVSDYLKVENRPFFDSVVVNENNDKPRKYQVEAMQIAINTGGGLYIMGTGAGKTLCTALLALNLLHNKLTEKVLIICPSPDLVSQTAREISYNLQQHSYLVVSWYGSKKLNTSADIIVAGSDIMRSRYDGQKDFLDSINAIIVDEAHQLKLGNKIANIIAKLPAQYRYGFTGTLPENEIDKWSVIGKLGPVRYDLPSAELREQKFLTPVKALCINVLTKNLVGLPEYYAGEVEYLGEHAEFNNLIVRIVKCLDNNSLVLFNRIAHGEFLTKLLRDSGTNKKIFYINGDMPVEERTAIREQMEQADDIIVVAQSSIFSTGINVKNIHNIVFPGLIGKSAVKTIQSVGRILRLHANKVEAKVIDIIPNVKYALRHAAQRKEIYESEKIPYDEVVISL